MATNAPSVDSEMRWFSIQVNKSFFLFFYTGDVPETVILLTLLFRMGKGLFLKLLRWVP